MIRHPGDGDLILLFYRKLDPASAIRIESHLAHCAACHATWVELGDVFRVLDADGVPEPADGFERVMWTRVSQALPRRGRWTWRGLAPLTALGAATAALLVVAATAHRAGPSDATGVAAPAATASVAASEDRAQRHVLFAALDEHLAQTELLLIELMNAPVQGNRPLQFEREAAGELVASGRLYRATARGTRDSEFALVLEEIEPVLIEVARSSSRTGPAELESWRGRIAEEDLLFKVRAAATEVRVRQRSLMPVSEGTP